MYWPKIPKQRGLDIYVSPVLTPTPRLCVFAHTEPIKICQSCIQVDRMLLRSDRVQKGSLLSEINACSQMWWSPWMGIILLEMSVQFFFHLYALITEHHPPENTMRSLCVLNGYDKRMLLNFFLHKCHVLFRKKNPFTNQYFYAFHYFN